MQVRPSENVNVDFDTCSLYSIACGKCHTFGDVETTNKSTCSFFFL